MLPFELSLFCSYSAGFGCSHLCCPYCLPILSQFYPYSISRASCSPNVSQQSILGLPREGGGGVGHGCPWLVFRLSLGRGAFSRLS